MKKLLLFLSLLAFAPRLATAQEAQTAVGAEKVIYSRAVPKALRAFVPRGGKSRFWGATNLKYQGQKVWVHFYDVRRAKWTKPKEEDPYALQKSGLDLFTISKSRRLNRISSTQFDYQRWDVDKRGVLSQGKTAQSVGAYTLWLDSKTKTLPIVVLTLSGTSGLMFEEQEILIVLDNKFKHGIVQQGFGSGAGGGGGGGYSFSSSFSGIDESGLVMITSSMVKMEGTDITTYKWNGKKFVAVGSKFEYREQ